jgi:hypothetical protein
VPGANPTASSPPTSCRRWVRNGGSVSTAGSSASAQRDPAPSARQADLARGKVRALEAEQRAIRDALAAASVAAPALVPPVVVTPGVATLVEAKPAVTTLVVAMPTAAPQLPAKKEVPTFHEWFTGRFWGEWVVGRRNKPTEVKSKQYIYERHLKKVFGHMRLDEIGAGEVAAFRASLVDSGRLGEKRINNVLAVLSKALRYAFDVELIVTSKPCPINRILCIRCAESAP